jgi:isoleucyl-tRNA synthetase
MGVDVMRWLFAKARPEDNILFGWHAADETRRELLVLWNVYSFFVTYARLAEWTPTQGIDKAITAAGSWPALDRWILSRAAGLAATVGADLDGYDALAASRAVGTFIDDLSTWYLRRSRDRMRAGADPADRAAAFATLHAAIVSLARTIAPILPFVSETMYQNLVVSVIPQLPDSVHLTAWPAAEMAELRDVSLERSMAAARKAVELARTLRSQAGHRIRQPLAKAWLAIPDRGLDLDDELLALVADEINVKAVERIGSESELVERRVKPLLPKIGKRLGASIPAVMAAAREGALEIHADGSVTLAGQVLAPDEVEILASPRPGTAVAHDEGLVIVIDTELTPELIAEGDARELQRAIQDLRRDAGLALDDRIDVWVEGLPDDVARHLDAIAREVLAEAIVIGVPDGGEPTTDGSIQLASGPVAIRIRRRSRG